ncbi:hypothetical protein E8E13_011142 [Curvularia kusanoi]|uniref:Uncharacterized protein n=1 Tax=Curvularia kusanoi TaxID=90978 RepID=A0A9P4TJC1_CURKU|nr:hypothetical protein E8E13_011142 [Curvularia kusanoi]
MTSNTYRALASQNNMDAHAHMMAAYTLLEFSKSFTREPMTDPSRRANMQAPSAQSTGSNIGVQPKLPLSTQPATKSVQLKKPQLIVKLKVRNIQNAFVEEPRHAGGLPSLQDSSGPHPRHTDSVFSSQHGLTNKRTSSEASFDDGDDDTDSEIEILPQPRKPTKPSLKTPTSKARSPRPKRVKFNPEPSDSESNESNESDYTTPKSHTVLASINLKRADRMLDPNNPEHAALIAAAPKAGTEYYDSDAEELLGPVKDTSKPHLFRNVQWGSLASDYSDPNAFPAEPEFTQFVPGRYELLPNGTAYDQKHKLLIRLTDTSSRRRIFTNPPPRDWTNQSAITALNKRSVQQIRRNTPVRFREVVTPYIAPEREWITQHLKDGKPTGGWRAFVDAFNEEFAGKKH